MRTGSKARAPHLEGAAPPAPHLSTLDIASAGDTPILREYRAVKNQFQDAIVLARLGDFFEMFGPDAEAAAPILGVTLTSRGFGSAGRIPMCGVPQQAMPQHVRRLLDAGRRVALWDQVGEVVSGKLVRREVTRVLSPGMVVEGEFLDASAVSRCVALSARDGTVGIAAFDASSQTLELLEVDGGLDSPAVIEELTRLDAREVLVADGTVVPPALAGVAACSRLAASVFDPSRAAARIAAAAGTDGIEGLALESVPLAQTAAGAVLAYCDRARIVISADLLRISVRAPGTTMRLDAHTRRNLELLASLGDTGVSLLQLLDRTRTPMGLRLLRGRLQEPLRDAVIISARLDAVDTLVRDRAARADLRDALTGVRDLDRMVGRCVQQSGTPRDLSGIRDACIALAQVRGAAGAVEASSELREAVLRCHAPPDLVERLRHLLADDPPANALDGGAIRPGADAELDSLRAASAGARSYIATLEARERERTGIRSLRVGYNRVFGYYIEVGNAHRGDLPDGYTRKQTLSGGERYVTADLKEQEAIVLHARERAIARERELLAAASELVASRAAVLSEAAGAVATIDVAQSLATVADDQQWARPTVDMSNDLDIRAGRHPLVERALGAGRFVPNDCSLDAGTRALVLTGPNMAGKSTYLRQTAIIVLLAQIGSFVPAESARIGVCDRIFTRIGAHDDLSGGMSTFMIEMAETAGILRQATGRSLVILDEIGRGTSTYDGISIAQAVLEHLHDSPQLNCRTLFATHFYELTALAGTLPRVRNVRVEVVDEGDEVTFLHRIVAGGADRSYGIHVARLAGVPAGVLLRARHLLAEQERTRPLTTAAERRADQLSLAIVAPPPHEVVSELLSLDIDSLSPIAALNKLAELRERASE